MASGEIIFIEGEDGARVPDANSLFVEKKAAYLADIDLTRFLPLTQLGRNEKGKIQDVDFNF